jgi:hypothetical protein
LIPGFCNEARCVSQSVGALRFCREQAERSAESPNLTIRRKLEPPTRPKATADLIGHLGGVYRTSIAGNRIKKHRLEAVKKQRWDAVFKVLKLAAP